MNNRFLSRAFQACFSACESLPATSFLQGAKIQHFLLICKKNDKKVSDLTFERLESDRNGCCEV